MLRLPPQLHARVAALASAAEKSINVWIAEQLKKNSQTS